MAFIGSLITTVKADTRQFDRKMKNSSKTVKFFKASLVGIGASAALFGAALAGRAVSALVSFTKESFKAMDATAKLASELEMSTEALTSYSVAAGLTGVNNDQLTKAIQRMVRNVGEARSGVTTGTKALQDFGLSLKEIEGLNTQQTFEKIIDKISMIEDPMQRSAKAALIFGKSGQKLINFFKLGTKGIKEINKEMEELGILFSSTDAAKIEAANDAILKMETMFKSIGNTIAIQIAPAIEKAADLMTDWAKDAGGIDQVIEDIATDTLVWINRIKSGFETLDSFLKFVTPGRMLGEFIGDDIAEMITGDMEEERQQVRSFFGDIEKGAEKAAKEVEELRKAQTLLDKQMRERAERIKAAEAENKILEAEQKSVVDAAKAIFEKTRTPLERVNKEIEEAHKKLKSVFLSNATELRGGIRREIETLKKEKFEILRASRDTVSENARNEEDRLISRIDQIKKNMKRFAKEGLEAEALADVERTQKKLAEMERRENREIQFRRQEDKAREAKNIAERAKTQEQLIIERIDYIEKLFAEGFFKGFEHLAVQRVEQLQQALAEINKAENEANKKREEGIKTKFEGAGFKELDLRHIDIKGVDRALTVDKKQLAEQEKQTAILSNINGNLRGGQVGAVAQ